MLGSISRYRILKQLDATGSNQVYLAEDPSSRTVIVRVYGDDVAQEQESFFSAARAWTVLDYPGIVPVLDTGAHERQLFVVTPFVAGTLLRELISRNQLGFRDMLGAMSGLASGLAHLHRRGIVLGQLNPSGLIVDTNGSITVVDPCLGRFLRERWPDRPEFADPEVARYLSPECVLGTPVDVRADIFAFGAILFEVLSGRPAFPGIDIDHILSAIRNAPPDLRDSSLPLDARLSNLIEWCLQKDLDRRCHDFNQVVERLESCRMPPAPTRALDENVQFTVYRRSVVAPDRWYPMLAFAHLAERRPHAPPGEPDPVAEVRRQAQQVLGETTAFQAVVQDSRLPIPERGQLRFVPYVEGVEFNPLERSFRWTESVHREEFRLRASRTLEGRVARGTVAIYLQHLLVAEITVAIRVDSLVVSAEAIADEARPYRRIFASYSHRDTAIVEELEDHIRSLGDEYLRDVTQLRSGELWSPRLAQLIADADVFQLFWSWNSLQSPFVRAEWEHALKLGRSQFIRPVYWEEPLPSTTDLPPAPLRALHFRQIRPRGVVPMPRDASPFAGDNPFASGPSPSPLLESEAPLAAPAAEELDPLELLNLGRRSPPRNAPGARDLELKSLDGSFRQPAVVPSSPPATPSARAPHEDATAIPHEYDPLASDEPPLPPRTAQSEPPRSVPVDERGAERSQIDAVTRILQGAGLDPADVTPELAQTFGQIIRVIVSGVMDVLQSRQQIKDEFRMRTTRLRPVENNPLKFSANVDDALHNLLAKRNPAYLGPVTAFEDAFADLRKHQLAMLTGIRVAFEAMLAEFDPDRLQEQFDRQLSKGLVPAKLRYWDLFRERHGEIARDPQASFHRLFGEEFARAYEEQLQQLE